MIQILMSHMCSALQTKIQPFNLHFCMDNHGQMHLNIGYGEVLAASIQNTNPGQATSAQHAHMDA